MKFSRVLWVLILIGLTSAVAKADGADPSVLLGMGHGSPSCQAGYGAAPQTPIFLIDGDPGDCVYNGPATTDIYIDVIPSSPAEDTFFESEKFVCENGIASGCTSVSPAVVPGLPAVEYDFSGPFAGFGAEIPNGADLDIEEVAIVTAEPGTMLLFLCGLACLAGLGYKRRELSLS